MKTIEERAKAASEGYDDDGYSAGLYMGYKVGAIEQKEIDEEVRLKKCDDMTKEEYDREEAFALWYAKQGKGTPTFSDAIEWARKEIINKACEWLKEHIYEYIAVGNTDFGKPYDIHLCDEELFEDFRNAMEE